MRTFIVVIILMVAFAGFNPRSASAQLGGLPFGGYVLWSFFCTCSGNWLISVGPPRGGLYSYNYTPQYANFRLPTSQMWVLGLYSPGGICLIYVGMGCSTFAVPVGTITPTVGTSL